MNNKSISDEISELKKKIISAERAYYVDASPIMSDSEFDALFDRLKELEEDNPEFKDPNSPTSRIGSDIDHSLPEREHTIPVLSLDKCYSVNEINNWINRISNKTTEMNSVIVEPKIDGAGVVLYYDNGVLQYALTRGNGYIGNDITYNVRTIRSVPLEIEYKKKLAVRGEIYIEKKEFEIFNQKLDNIYANPRNLASGAVRRLKSSESASFPLKLFVYEGFFDEIDFSYHHQNLEYLVQMGFPVNDHIGFFGGKYSGRVSSFKDFTSGSFSDLSSYVEKFTDLRNSLNYEIDGLVIKVDNLNLREDLGFTSHHPRWAIAYKFESQTEETVIESISVQIGRGGRVTPVAALKPVLLGGSTISRATLHNQDYIDTLNVNVGDTVLISKRGDVIPAVEEVISKSDNKESFKIDEKCPVCDSNFVKDGAHLFCVNAACPSRELGRLKYFVGKKQMDIDTLGEKTLEFLYDKEYVKNVIDLYTFDYNTLIGQEGFQEKKVNNIISSISDSKNRPFEVVLSSLGFKDIGIKVSKLLCREFKNVDSIIENALKRDVSIFESIDGIGSHLSTAIIEIFTDEDNIKLFKSLEDIGLQLSIEESSINNDNGFLKGTKWVITGSFVDYNPRSKAQKLIESYGGEVTTSVTSKTDFLLCGEGSGSKLKKAQQLGIQIVDEEKFNRIITNKNYQFIQ